MKSIARRSRLIVVVMFCLLAATILYVVDNISRADEWLVVWGWEGDLTDRKCSLQINNPEKQKQGPVYINNESCNYQVVNIEGQPRLIWEQKEPRAIIIYTITANGELTIDKNLPIEGLKAPWFSLKTQFGDDDAIYFAGILENATGLMQDRMQLLRMDPRTGRIGSLAAHEDGMVDEPVLSPDGTKLIYSVFAGLKTWSDCRSFCAPRYYLLDLTTDSVTNLTSLVNHLASDPIVTHCNLHWSPDARFIAFNLGCESDPPHYIVIFDVQNNKERAIIKPIEETSDAILLGWLSNNEIIYEQSVPEEGHNFYLNHFYRFSLVTNTSKEIMGFPQLTSEGLGVVGNVSWTPDGNYLTASVNAENATGTPLLIMNIDSDKSVVDYIASDTINELPLWSPSGEWIAYSSFEDSDDWWQGKKSIKIISRSGLEVVDTKLSGILRGVNYVWLSQ